VARTPEQYDGKGADSCGEELFNRFINFDFPSLHPPWEKLNVLTPPPTPPPVDNIFGKQNLANILIR
jgi:hypothetical protein